MPRRIEVGVGVVLVCCGCSLDARTLALTKGGDVVEAADAQIASDGSVDAIAAEGSSYARTQVAAPRGSPAVGDAQTGGDEALDASRAEDGSQVQVDQDAEGRDADTIGTTPNDSAREADATSVPNVPEPNVVDSGVGDAGGGSNRPDDAAGDAPSEAVATDSGNWDGAASLVDCGPPAKPSNGEVNAPSTILGSSATYTCKEGYYRQGVQDRVCQAAGTWSETTPTCDFVDCKAPPNLANGTVQATRTSYGAEAKYKCLVGHDLSGSTTRTCQADGSWSGTPGSCVLKSCDILAAPPRGKMEVTGTTHGSFATYACAAPSVLSGPVQRYCQMGTWTGTAPVCQPPRSCQGGQVGAGMDCGGANGTDDCCASPLVEGGTFNRDNDTNYPATVSSFRLDKYEITVGRFRAFVAAGMGTQASPPASGSGANPNVAGSGWDAAWNASLAATSSDLTSNVQGLATEETWTGTDDKRPMNYISWYEAFAFCIWDGGRLPTELEWNYAAAGGSEQRKYPWGSTEPGANTELAMYAFSGRSCSGVACIGAVGSASAGNGKWGQADLAGNVQEWNLDWSGVYASSGCTDCANLSSTLGRVIRGGHYNLPAVYQTSSWHFPGSPRNGFYDASTRFTSVGARCARTP